MSFWSDKRVVVPGGAGFIGSYLVEQLVDLGASVNVVDNLETGHLHNLQAVRDQVDFTEGDVTDMEFARAAFDGADVVMNMAARAPGVGVSHRSHVELLGRNVQVGTVALEAARQAGVPRFLVVSSSCVYPDDAPVPTPELPVCTGEPERVNSGYGWAKRYLELQAMHYADRFGMEIAIGRPFNAYGARDIASGAGSHVIPSLIDKALGDGPALTVWGSGQQTRSFIHARDVAAALILITERHAACEAINVGHSAETRMLDLARMLIDVAGVDKAVVCDPSKPEGCLRKAADTTRLREVTGGFEPGTDLSDGLVEMVQAHRAARAARAGERRPS